MMRSTTKAKSYTKKVFIKLGVAAFWLLVWELVYRAVAQEILVVSPVRAVRRLAELAGTDGFWQALSGTGLRVLNGFLLALVMGGVLAVLTRRFLLLYELFHPVLEVVKSTPVASFIILALIWLSTSRVPEFIVFLMAMPLVWANLYAGLLSVDRELLEMAQVFRLSRWKMMRLIYFPALMPYFMAACTTGLGLSWKSAIAAEVIAHPARSIGTQIYNARIYLETADLFAWTAAVIALSVLLEKLTVLLLDAMSRRLLGESGGGDADDSRR